MRKCELFDEWGGYIDESRSVSGQTSDGGEQEDKSGEEVATIRAAHTGSCLSGGTAMLFHKAEGLGTSGK